VTWLVTGGAGYIGAHVVRGLRQAGYGAVVLDDLSTGLADRVPEGVPLVTARVTDRRAVVLAMRRHAVEGVIHLAARKSVTESMVRPAYYYRENVGGLASLLSVMADAGVRRFVFSSSAAVYGAASVAAVGESAATVPVNPYGRSKLLGERLVRSAGMAGRLSWVALRYFNVVGAAHSGLVDPSQTNLVPLALRAAASGRAMTVMGADHPTRDGTAVRDYIHVEDLADVHILVAAMLTDAGQSATVFNAGTGSGHSVLDVLRCVKAATGQPVPYRVGARRAGDPSHVVARTDRIRRELGWWPRRTLADMITSMWPVWRPYRRPSPSAEPAELRSTHDLPTARSP